MNILKRETSAAVVAALLSLYTLVAFHYPFFSYVASNVEGGLNGVLIVGGLAVIMLALNFLMGYATLWLGRVVGKVLLTIALIGNSIALYFINTYEVLITDKMMGNVFNTRFSEASGFFSLSAVLYVVLLGIVPCIYLWSRKVEYGSLKSFGKRVGLSFAVVVGCVALNVQNFTWIDRHATHIGSVIMPWSYVVNTVRYNIAVYKANRKEIPLPDATIANDDKSLCVVIIGESARRDHFSLYGYERATNPRLAQRDDVVALKATSAATYTTAGLKAILSHNSEDELYEILPNYLHRHGVDVVWRTTNWGEPPLHIEKVHKAQDIKTLYPSADDRYDGILLEGLKQIVEACDKPKQLIVLHTSTSHGPMYYSRYPFEFEQFTPVCTTVEMAKADHDELMNAYDNTILYTDYLIDSAIALLEGFTDRRTALIYLSDHGESLGENNLYMHGVPMMMAPREQIEIPFIVWCSDKTQQIKPLDEVGQYHLFHSVMRHLALEGGVYNADYDIFQ